jgi:hypothetical protein
MVAKITIKPLRSRTKTTLPFLAITHDLLKGYVKIGAWE